MCVCAVSMGGSVDKVDFVLAFAVLRAGVST